LNRTNFTSPTLANGQIFNSTGVANPSEGDAEGDDNFGETNSVCA
jgi:hypothetical protein